MTLMTKLKDRIELELWYYLPHIGIVVGISFIILGGIIMANSL